MSKPISKFIQQKAIARCEHLTSRWICRRGQLRIIYRAPNRNHS